MSLLINVIPKAPWGERIAALFRRERFCVQSNPGSSLGIAIIAFVFGLTVGNVFTAIAAAVVVVSLRDMIVWELRETRVPAQSWSESTEQSSASR